MVANPTGKEPSVEDPTVEVEEPAEVPIACPHPEHRLGTHGRLKKHQRVCMTCGAVVLVRRR